MAPGESSAGNVFGMQKTVVKPPAAAAAVPRLDRLLVGETGFPEMDVDVDQPGATTSPAASMVRIDPSGPMSPTTATTPSRMRRSA
jgi:hypothetical protein